MNIARQKIGSCNLNEKFTQKVKFCHHKITFMQKESRVKSSCPQNIFGASQRTLPHLDVLKQILKMGKKTFM